MISICRTDSDPDFKLTKNVLLSKSMTAVASKAIVGHHGKRSLAMSQISVTSGCFMQNCHRTYEVSVESARVKVDLWPIGLTPCDKTETKGDEEPGQLSIQFPLHVIMLSVAQNTHPSNDTPRPGQGEDGQTDVFGKQEQCRLLPAERPEFDLRVISNYSVLFGKA